ncbi:cytochrome P450 [Peterkaempfera sp. SMS 1(5)a]|uniref:cytochrome P450 n=1 Tax=Peterkaempfera podocarpi TaxID=3232308 RepID=UPI0036716030
MSVTPGQSVPEQPLVPLHCLRFAEPGPPRQAALPNDTPVWLVSRHRDARQVLTDPAFGRALLYAPDAPPLTSTPNMLDDPDSLLNQDGPDHQRLRRTVQRAFTPRAVARWRPWVAAVVEQLVDDLVKSGPPADAVAGFSTPLPVAVISRLMALDGLDQDRMRHWSNLALSDSSHSPEEVGAALREFGAFAAQLIAERRRDPGEDLVSTLLAAAAAEGSIPERQLVSLVCGLVVGGHETTMTSLGNALVYLLSEAPESWARLGADEEAAGVAVEQLLRSIPLGEPRELPGTARRASVAVEVGGVTIPAGAVVAVQSQIANRDPEVYAEGQFGDLFAPLPAPSLTFGAGPHHCLGAWLARMEMQLALHRLSARLPGLRLAEPVEAIDWRRGSITRSPQRLTVVW